MNEKVIFITSDGSHSVFSTQFQADYHSKHGAIQESQHIFIEAGLKYKMQFLSEINVLEMGFGTGLNVLLTYLEAKKKGVNIHFTSYELYPLALSEVQQLNYAALLGLNTEEQTFFTNIHAQTKVDEPNFYFKKCLQPFETLTTENTFDVVYYDAFAPETQPELWSETVFTQIFQSLKNNGILTTYCAKGAVKRALRKVGFAVQSLAGPIGKREITRAIKTD